MNLNLVCAPSLFFPSVSGCFGTGEAEDQAAI